MCTQLRVELGESVRQVDIDCLLAHSNLERSRVARLDDAALAQHDAALLKGLDEQPAAQQRGGGGGGGGTAAESRPNARASSPAIAVAAPRAPFGLPAAAGSGFGRFSFGTGAAPPEFRGGAGAGGGGGVTAKSAPSKLSPVAAAAAAGQRRRRGAHAA